MRLKHNTIITILPAVRETFLFFQTIYNKDDDRRQKNTLFQVTYSHSIVLTADTIKQRMEEDIRGELTPEENE